MMRNLFYSLLLVKCNMIYVINRIELQEVYECKISSCNHIILDKNSFAPYYETYLTLYFRNSKKKHPMQPIR